jgi:putative two-component system response regulator
MNGNFAKTDHTHAKILLADDHPGNVTMLEQILTAQGYHNFDSTTDSRKLVGIYESYRPDLLMLDLKMPYIDGMQIMKQLKETLKTDILPVIIMVTEADQESLPWAMDLGARDFIRKPFDHDELKASVRNVLDISVMNREANEHFSMINLLLQAIEFRGKIIDRHVLRTGLYCAELAKLAGLSVEVCDRMVFAGMFHDLGKVGIPDEVLLKPGKLDAAEWEIMKKHTIKGAKLLTGNASETMRLAEQVAFTHHERWDGTGYPRGVKGEEIPMPGRIMAIVDMFDALLYQRAYKEAGVLEDAIAAFQNASGKYFDPKLVAIFLKNLSRFLEIKEQCDS